MSSRLFLHIVFSLSFTVVLLASVTVYPGLKKAEAASPQVAFASERDGNREIYVMNGDGSGQMRLTNNAAFDSEPKWSPDGTKIAFHSDRDGNSEVYVMNGDGSNQVRLTNNAASDGHPAWSPDGTRVAFHSDRDGDYDIYVMNADGTDQVQLTNAPLADVSPDWSPDGTRIAFHSGRDGMFEVYVMNADGSGQTNLTNNPSSDGAPDWSPDGSRIAFHSHRTGSADIYLMNPDGSGLTQLTTHPSEDADPAWSRDGTRIAFHSLRDGNFEIYGMKADGSDQVRLTNTPSADQYPSWSNGFDNTPVGSPVTVPLNGSTITFSTVTVAGNTTYTSTQGNPAGGTPSGFRVRGNFVDIETTATFGSPITLCISYNPLTVHNEDKLKLFHWDGSGWVDVTTSVDTVNNRVCGEVTSLSPFFIGEPNASVATATSTGTATFYWSSTGPFVNLAARSIGSVSPDGRPDLVFGHGLFEFDITGLSNGQTVTVTIELPYAVPTNAEYWKWNSTMGWYQIPFGSNDGDNIITITLQDGATGDDDFTVNGVINDQGGPGWPFFGGGVPRGAPAFPSIYIGIGAALGAGILAYLFRRRLAKA